MGSSVELRIENSAVFAGFAGSTRGLRSCQVVSGMLPAEACAPAEGYRTREAAGELGMGAASAGEGVAGGREKQVLFQVGPEWKKEPSRIASFLLRGVIDFLSMLPGDLVRWRILVVDNEPLVTDSIKWILAHDGHQVEVTSNAEQALRLFERGKFDLVIADYEMPKLKGDELALRIHALDPEQRVLLITAHTEQLVSTNALLKGVDMVLGKPFDIETLRKAVAQLATKP